MATMGGLVFFICVSGENYRSCADNVVSGGVEVQQGDDFPNDEKDSKSPK